MPPGAVASAQIHTHRMLCMYTYMYMSPDTTHTHARTHIYACVYIDTYVCVCVCVSSKGRYIYIHCIYTRPPSKPRAGFCAVHALADVVHAPRNKRRRPRQPKQPIFRIGGVRLSRARGDCSRARRVLHRAGACSAACQAEELTEQCGARAAGRRSNMRGTSSSGMSGEGAARSSKSERGLSSISGVRSVRNIRRMIRFPISQGVRHIYI